jgi:hydroxyethylthiazole kinase-like uncharacterized protein yjeF
MRRAYDVAAVRAAEERAMAVLGPEALMAAAAAGLARICRALLVARGGRLTDASVALLVGSGNNGGDTLYAGAALARRGVAVTAVLVAPTAHEAGLAALVAAGGRVQPAADAAEVAAATKVVRGADVVLDGIVGIGGRGALADPAATLVRSARTGEAFLLAVDVPSGVDADTGAVTDPATAFAADLTVTFGCLKPGLLVAPGRDYAGAVELIDIGLNPYLPQVPLLRSLQGPDLGEYVRGPGPADHKYSRGVVGVVAGSKRYPGAALLCVGGARRSGVGMVRFADRGDGVAERVVTAYPDVVLQTDDPDADPRVSAWVVGPGIGDSRADERWLLRVLTADVPVVLDADALRLYVASADVREKVRGRVERGSLTVLTPHTGEFAAMFGDIGPEGRVAAARSAAERSGCIVVLKGSGTLVAARKGAAYVDPVAAHELATAGSGDVLSGLLGGFLAHRAARQMTSETARAIAAAVYVHGLAAKTAAGDGLPVVATDLLESIGPAIASLRGSR